MQKNKQIRRLGNCYKNSNDLIIQYLFMFFELVIFIVIILGEEIVYDVSSACRCQ